MKRLNFSLGWFCPGSNKGARWAHLQTTSPVGLWELGVTTRTSFSGDPPCLDALFPISILMGSAWRFHGTAQRPARYLGQVGLSSLEETEPMEDMSLEDTSTAWPGEHLQQEDQIQPVQQTAPTKSRHLPLKAQKDMMMGAHLIPFWNRRLALL